MAVEMYETNLEGYRPRFREASSGSQENEIAKFSTANASLLIWLLLLTFGGGLLSLYYARIGYFPDIKWEESLTYLSVLSLVGGSLVLTYILLLFVPGLIWSEFLIFDTELQETLCYKGDKGREPCMFSILKHIGAPFSIFMLVAHVFALAGFSVLVVVAFLCLAMISIWQWRKFKRRLGPYRQHTDADPRSLLIKYVSAFDVSAIVSFASLITIYSIIKPERAQLSAILWICTSVVIVANLAVAVQYRRRPARAVATSILAAFILLVSGEVVADNPSATLPARIMALYGFGGEETVTVLVTEKGRHIAEQYGIPVAGKSLQNGGGTIKNVQILS
ncbi:MAG TPA: hypothetical protein VIW92_03665, partial [Thermoanaerobaculia bacterium]